MKNLVGLGAGLLLCAASLVGCGGAGDGIVADRDAKPAFSDSEVRAKSADAALDQNLTPSQYEQAVVDMAVKEAAQKWQVPDNRSSLL
ncbi:hypothetical protein RD149_19915 [Gordonia westfalica]|uniref:Uncharacterized protein n=1 Tax=Gordonia westfalica TaxID=158898 RepID=A0ABU2GX29_9ACTN|nr:hypothetical protein [Gordonia westfalica]MDS1116018.1 hypothetical protein [Gordonia westfalica]